MAQEVMTIREQAIEYLTFISGGETPSEQEIQDYLKECEESLTID